MSKIIRSQDAALGVTSLKDHLPKVDPMLAGFNKAAKVDKTTTLLEQLKQQAKLEGRKEGYLEGLEKGRREALRNLKADCEAHAASFAAELQAIVDVLQTSIQQFYRNAEESLAGLAVAIAARIVAREVETSPETALAIAKEAIAEVTHAESATVRVNPFHSEIVREHAEQLKAVSPSLKGIQIVDDPSIAGGCVIESAGGRIDASIEFRVRAMLEAMLDHYDVKGKGSVEKAA